MSVFKAYDFIEHTGDIGIRVYGQNHRELFQNAFMAFFEILVEFERVMPSQKRMIIVENNGWERLLVSWLS